MNVLLINGSPHANGCTDAALREVAKALNADGIETTIFHIGAAPVAGCIGCGGCAKTGKCVFGGPVQSASRSYLSKLIPPGREGEIFGLYATTGRITADGISVDLDLILS